MQPHAGAMSGPVECRYYGRDFTAKEISVLGALIAETPPRNRFNFSKLLTAAGTAVFSVREYSIPKYFGLQRILFPRARKASRHQVCKSRSVVLCSY